MTPTQLLAASLARIQSLEAQVRDLQAKLDRAHVQFSDMARIAEECLSSSIVRGGKITKADAQIVAQIN